jgi:putative transcription antitermination factor YqgF
MAILAIDLGEKKCGLARTDEQFVVGGGVAAGYGAYDRFIDTIKSVVGNYKIDRLVIGVPKSKSGEQADKYGAIIDRIKADTNLPVTTVDETLSSFEARRRQPSNIPNGDDDEAAAKIILEDYLNQNR